MGASTTKPASLGKRVLWLLVIWASSVAALGAAALVMRLIMRAAGMTG
jgi:hypothetical protein